MSELHRTELYIANRAAMIAAVLAVVAIMLAIAFMDE